MASLLRTLSCSVRSTLLSGNGKKIQIIWIEKINLKKIEFLGAVTRKVAPLSIRFQSTETTTKEETRRK